ncbi:MAG: hypothetical protein ABW043_09895 [Devosia sp.]|uniref:hypothetical protein n=1 Tax=Devosia sp. TaxID=1871048 RepID=UPI00339701A9
MSKLLATALGLLLATPSLAADWKYEGGSVPIAYFDNGDAQFQFACRGGDLAMAYWVRKPSKEVAAAASLSLAINASGATSGSLAATGGTIFAQDFPLIHNDGSSILVRGPVARQWAAIAQRAADLIRVGFVRHKGQGGLEVFDGQEFGASGSNAAIAKVLRQCG